MSERDDVVQVVVEAWEALSERERYVHTPRELSGVLDDLVEEYREAKHILDLRDDHSWTIQHPLSCRPNLFTCPVSDAFSVERISSDFGWEPGVYEVEFDGEVVRVGERLGP